VRRAGDTNFLGHVAFPSQGVYPSGPAARPNAMETHISGEENPNEAVREENRLQFQSWNRKLPEKNRRRNPTQKGGGRPATVRQTRDECATYSYSSSPWNWWPHPATVKQRVETCLRNTSSLRHQTPETRFRKFPSYQSAANGKPVPAYSFTQSCRGCSQSKPAGEVIDLARLPYSNCEQEGKTVDLPSSRSGACVHSSLRPAP
jgi:hypothetical protein